MLYCVNLVEFNNLYFGVIDLDLVNNRGHVDIDVHIIVDCSRDKKAFVPMIVRGKIRSATPKGKPKWRPYSNHRRNAISLPLSETAPPE